MNPSKKAAVVGLGVSATEASAEETYNGYELPPYQVERLICAAGVRMYQPHLIAEVTVRGAQDQALRRGFQVLAGYIFGGNTAAASIDMTTPVAQRPSEKVAMTTPLAQTG